MSTATFIASQKNRPRHPVRAGVQSAGSALLHVLRPAQHTPSPARRRRAEIDAAVAASFEASGGTYGSPRVLCGLRLGPRPARDLNRPGIAGGL